RREREAGLFDEHDGGVKQKSAAHERENDRNDSEKLSRQRDNSDRDAGSDENPDRGVKPRERPLKQARTRRREVELAKEHPPLLFAQPLGIVLDGNLRELRRYFTRAGD